MHESPFGSEKDLLFMRMALKQAMCARRRDEVPIGAIVVDASGKVIGRGYNQVEKQASQTFHAEMIALARAGKKRGDWRLEGCWVYVTLEPCAMCMNLIKLSRCSGVVYGVLSPIFGYQLVDKGGTFSVYKENVVCAVAGPCAQESATMLKSFFKEKRQKKKEKSREKSGIECSRFGKS